MSECLFLFLWLNVLIEEAAISVTVEKVDVERFIRGLRGGQGSVIRGEELLEIVRGWWFSCCSDLELQRVFLISAR